MNLVQYKTWLAFLYKSGYLFNVEEKCKLDFYTKSFPLFPSSNATLQEPNETWQELRYFSTN